MVCRTAGSRTKGQGAKAGEMQELQQNLFFFLSLYPGALLNTSVDVPPQRFVPLVCFKNAPQGMGGQGGEPRF